MRGPTAVFQHILTALVAAARLPKKDQPRPRWTPKTAQGSGSTRGEAAPEIMVEVVLGAGKFIPSTEMTTASCCRIML